MLLTDTEEDFLAGGEGITFLGGHSYGITAAGVLRRREPSFGNKVVLFVAEDMIRYR
jgi:hypothetical protein